MITSASGIRSSTRALSAEGFRRFDPDVALATGSTTRDGMLASRRALAASRIIAAENSMPVFAETTGKAEHTASICLPTNPFGVGAIPVTPSGFWAVRQVIALVPKTPRAENVLRSAWIPAPPPLSDPAIVMATGVFRPLGLTGRSFVSAQHARVRLLQRFESRQSPVSFPGSVLMTPPLRNPLHCRARPCNLSGS